MTHRTLLSLHLVLVVLACSGEETDGSIGPDEITPNETVEEVLQAFGVDITDTPRLDDDMEPIGEGYAPLGGRRTLSKYDEIQLIGVRFEGTPSSLGPQPLIDLMPTEGNGLTPVVLDDPMVDALPWLAADPSRRASTVGDFDGDGLEETAVVYQLEAENALLQVYDDLEDEFAISSPKVVQTTAANAIFTAAADYDGDGDADVVVALVAETDVSLVLFENVEGAFEDTDTSLSIPLLDGGNVYVGLEPGNIDRDNAFELGVVVNESASLFNTDVGSSRYFIFDDVNQDFAELKKGIVTAQFETETLSARTGNIALGDVDRDGMDEVVLGGLTAMGNTCDLESTAITTVLDDARAEFAVLAADQREFRDSRDPCASGSSQYMQFFPLTLPDLDGNGAAEIHAFEVIFSDFLASPGALTELYQIPQTDLLTEGSSGSSASYRFHWQTVEFAAGDVTSDGRDDVVFFKQTGNVGEQGVYIWGVDPIDGWQQRAFYPSAFENSQTPLRVGLELVDTDLDQDTFVIAYSEDSHRFVFTEPVVIAALAAPPCSRTFGGGAVDEACTTAFGKAITETMERTDSTSVFAEVSVGFEGSFSVFGVKVGSVEALANVRATAQWYSGSAYSLRKEVLRQTGNLEDSVIFTTIPMDIYTYEIISHPNPELVGGQLEVRMARSPITVMTTREFYNANILEDAMPIDDSVFSHIVGEPGSYPSAADKDTLLGQYTGVESDLVDVGQGAGFTLVSISTLSETSSGENYELEGSVSLKSTQGGFVTGLTIGGSKGFDIQSRHGEETIYQGAVANLAAEHFPAEVYSFGLFSYLLEDSDNAQPFEVLNYWVVAQP